MFPVQTALMSSRPVVTFLGEAFFERSFVPGRVRFGLTFLPLVETFPEAGRPFGGECCLLTRSSLQDSRIDSVSAQHCV